jgi:fatty acid synthase
MRAAGIEPDGIVGHSVGELGCSYMDGCFTAEQMLLAAYYRGRASIETELIKGLMAAVGKFAGHDIDFEVDVFNRLL